MNSCRMSLALAKASYIIGISFLNAWPKLIFISKNWMCTRLLYSINEHVSHDGRVDQVRCFMHWHEAEAIVHTHTHILNNQQWAQVAYEQQQQNGYAIVYTNHIHYLCVSVCDFVCYFLFPDFFCLIFWFEARLRSISNRHVYLL